MIAILFWIFRISAVVQEIFPKIQAIVPNFERDFSNLYLNRIGVYTLESS